MKDGRLSQRTRAGDRRPPAGRRRGKVIAGRPGLRPEAWRLSSGRQLAEFALDGGIMAQELVQPGLAEAGREPRPVRALEEAV